MLLNPSLTFYFKMLISTKTGIWALIKAYVDQMILHVKHLHSFLDVFL